MKVSSKLQKEFYIFEPKRIIAGLEIGDRTLRVAVLRETPREIQILKLISADILVKEGQNAKAKEAALASAIERIWRENKIKTRHLYAHIPRESLGIRFMSAPYMPEEELRQGLRFEAQPHFSFPLEKASIDYLIIDDISGPEGRMLELMVAACPNEVIEKWVQFFKKAGFRLRLLGPIPLALWTSFEKSEPMGRGGAVALLGLKDNQASLSIFMKEKLRFVRDIALRESLAGISPESTEEVVTEVSRTLDYYKAQSRIDRIDRLIISGEIKPPDLGSVLAERLGLIVEQANPLKNMRIMDEGIRTMAETMQPAFAAAIGLALSSQKDQPINLLPGEITKREGLFFYQKFMAWLIAGFLIIMVLAIQFNILAKKGSLVQKRNELTKKVNEFRHLYNDFSLFEKKRQETEKKLAFLSAKIKEQGKWSKILRDISEAIPDELWLMEIKSYPGQKNAGLELRGYGFSNQAVVEFVNRLKKKPYFNEVKLNFIRQEEVIQKKAVSFEVICQLKKAE